MHLECSLSPFFSKDFSQTLRFGSFSQIKKKTSGKTSGGGRPKLQFMKFELLSMEKPSDQGKTFVLTFKSYPWRVNRINLSPFLEIFQELARMLEPSKLNVSFKSDLWRYFGACEVSNRFFQDIALRSSCLNFLQLKNP